MGVNRASRAGVGTWICLLGSLFGSAGRAQNLVYNPSFDVDPVGWSLATGGTLLWTGLADEGDCSGSGAGLATSAESIPGAHVVVIEQCLAVPTPGATFHVRARHMGYGQFSIVLHSFGTVDCESGFLGSAGSPLVPQSPTEWQTSELHQALPGAAQSVMLQLTASDFEPHGLLVDGVEAATREPIFLDGFDGNEEGEAAPCRWLAP